MHVAQVALEWQKRCLQGEEIVQKMFSKVSLRSAAEKSKLGRCGHDGQACKHHDIMTQVDADVCCEFVNEMSTVCAYMFWCLHHGSTYTFMDTDVCVGKCVYSLNRASTHARTTAYLRRWLLLTIMLLLLLRILLCCCCCCCCCYSYHQLMN